jgi:hypothetical protein
MREFKSLPVGPSSPLYKRPGLSCRDRVGYMVWTIPKFPILGLVLVPYAKNLYPCSSLAASFSWASWSLADYQVGLQLG